MGSLAQEVRSRDKQQMGYHGIKASFCSVKEIVNQARDSQIMGGNLLAIQLIEV